MFSDLTKGLFDWWNALPQASQDNIINSFAAGLAVSVMVAIGALFRNSIQAIFKRLFGSSEAASTIPQPQPSSQSQEVKIVLETPQLAIPPQLSSPPVEPPDKPVSLPIIPRSSTSVDFVPRVDAQGRDLVSRIQEELSPEKNQLVILWGPGGVGKTTLAIEARRGLDNVFGQHIVWTSADGRSDYAFSTLLDEIASQLGRPDIRQLALEPKKDAVRSLIAKAPTMIVLDNFETISPGEQSLCTEWLAQDASCPILITTRDRINTGRNISVDVMLPDEAQQFVERLIQESTDPEVFVHLDRELLINTADRTPLVLEWIVAQIELAQKPQTVLDELTHGKGEVARRVFDRSFDLPQLGDDGRSALLALSLFVPSGSRPALAKVAGFDEDEERVNEAVKRLAALRLVRSMDNGQRLAVTGLTREMAKARLSEDPGESGFQQRFVAFLLRYAEEHKRITAEDFDALEVEKDNLLGAVDIAFELEGWASVTGIMDIIGKPVSGVLGIRGYWSELVRYGEKSREAAQNIGDQEGAAAFSHNVAVTYYRQGELGEARRLYEESLAINKELGNRSGIANSLHNLGALVQAQGELGEARRLYEESLAIKKELGNQSGIANSLGQLGVLAQDQGELGEARRLYEESLAINKELGNRSGIANSLGQLGRLAQDQGELGEARRLYEESLAINKELGNQSGIAISLHDLGRLAEESGDTEDAVQCLREALDIFEKLGSRYAEHARKALQRVEGK